MKELSSNDLFIAFIVAILVIVVLFGAGMLAVIFFGDHALGLRMINVFAAMFSGVLGLGSGYLLGSRNGKKPS